MTDLTYILAQRGTKIELVEGSFKAWDEGEAFIRNPSSGNEWWVVIKRFDGQEHDQLAALVKHMGFDKVQALFGASVLEDHSIPPVLVGDAFEMDVP